jgi:hypothetical protein
LEFYGDNQRGRAFAKRITNASSYCTDRDHDIIMELENKIGYFDGNVTHNPVKGHQDERHSKQLSREATMNVRADKLATSVLDDLAIHNKHIERIPIESCNCYLKHKGQIVMSGE